MRNLCSGLSMHPVPIFIGFDPREAIAYHVCCQSILNHATVPVAFYPLALSTLGDYDEQHTDGSNQFVYSRFLVPWILGNQHAIYMDGDMIVRADIAELWALRKHNFGVQVAKHDYKTKFAGKYLDSPNVDYPRKNWSSVMLWNCGFGKNRRLTPQFVAKQTGAFLHQFKWLDDDQIGELPAEWNHLCMEQEPNPAAKLFHYTIGIPAFPEYANQEGAWEWEQTLVNAMAPRGQPRAG